jgi:hypothetical protein
MPLAAALPVVRHRLSRAQSPWPKHQLWLFAGKSRLSCQDHQGNLSISNETTYGKGERSGKSISEGFRQVAARDILQQ